MMIKATLILYNCFYFLDAQVIGEGSANLLQTRCDREQCVHDDLRCCTNIRNLSTFVGPLADVQQPFRRVGVFE